MPTRNTTGKAVASPNKKSARLTSGVISIGYNGKDQASLKRFLIPLLEQGSAILLTSPSSSLPLGRLSSWLSQYRYKVKTATTNSTANARTIYTTPAGFRSYAIEDRIHLDELKSPLEKRREHDRLASVLHELNERIKEQACLYGITRLAATEPGLEQLLNGTVKLIPAGWQFPGQTCCSIRYGKKEYRSAGFKKTRWCQQAERKVQEGDQLLVSVYYKKKMPVSDEGPFLKYERSLLNSIADSLQIFIRQVLVNARSRQSESMLQEAQELALLGNWSYDLQQKKSYWSASVYDIFGVPRNESLRSFGAFFNQVVAKDRKRVEATMRKARRIGGAFTIDYCILTHAGEKKYIEEFGYSEQDEKGKVIRLYGTVQDITQRMKAEQELTDSEYKYRSLFEASPLPSYIFDRETLRILDVNRRMSEQYGYTREELLAMTIRDIRPADQIPLLQANLEKARHNKGVIHFGVMIHQHKDGTRKQVDINGKRIRLQNRDCIMVQAHDITDRVIQGNLDQLERNVIEMSLRGKTDIAVILSEYLVGLEALISGLMASILRVSDGRVYNWASPSLPVFYADALNGLTIGPAEGSCGTAAYTGKQVIVSSIEKSRLWKKYADLAKAAGLSACWSTPIFNPQGQVIATFANYYSEARMPSAIELEIFNRAAVLISILIESYEKEQNLRISYERFEHVTKATSDAIWDWNLVTDTAFCGEGFTSILAGALNEDEWKLSSWLGYTHPDDRILVTRNVEEALRGNEHRWEQEYRIIRKNGQLAYVSDRAYIIRDEKGRPVRIIGAIRDITEKREEEQRLRLLESVVTNTSDAVLITNAAINQESGPDIIYVNEAFCRMTGYKSGEVIGKTPAILEGPKTDAAEMSRLKLALKIGEPCTINVINYTKQQKEYRVEMVVKPMFDGSGQLTHYFAIQRDITNQFKQQQQSRFMEMVSSTFKMHERLVAALGAVLKKLVEFGDFTAAESWIISPDKWHFNLVASFGATKQAREYFAENKALNSLTPEGGLLKDIWITRQLVTVDNFDQHPTLRRREGVRKAGFKSAIAIPLLNKGELIGCLTVLTDKHADHLSEFEQLFKGLEAELGSEVKRKQLENELSITFNSAPDIISVAGFDGYFKRINPAATRILGYSTEELLSRPYIEFIHPDHIQATNEVSENLPDLSGSRYFENCYVSKEGKKVWLGWTYQQLPEENLIYSVAKDITPQKELQRLLSDASSLARIGAWEMDMATLHIYWSDVTRLIHEVPDDYQPVLDEVYKFYQDSDKPRLEAAVTKAINEGIPYDIELLHITAKGNERWVRVIGTPEMSNGKCVRLYGSFQDVHARKLAEIELQQRTRYLSANATVAQVFLSNEDWFDGVRNSFDLARYTVLADQIFYKEVFSDNTTGELMLRQRLGWLKGQDTPLIDQELVPPVPLSLFPEVYEVLMSDQHYAAVISELPDNALKQLLESIGIKSVLFLPVFTGSVLEGVVGVEECTYERRWSDGEIFFMRSLCSSLSSAIQRFRSKAALKEILEEKSEILESIGDGFFSVDKNWTVNYWNKQAELITRIPKEDILGRSIWEIFPIKEDSPGIKALLRAMETGEKGSYESFYAPLGIWVEGSIYPTRHGLTSYFKDVTVRKVAEEELRLSNERFEIVSEATNDAIRDWDITADVMYWGRGYRRLFGHEKATYEKALDKWFELIHPEERTAVRDSLAGTLADASHTAWNAEYRFQQADSTYAWVRDRGIILRNSEGLAYRLVGSVADITYQKEYEKSLKKLNEDLGKQTRELMISNAELEQFAYVASHDLQEPLRMVTSFLTKLQERYAAILDDRARRYIEFAVDGARRMRQNILGLLQYSRVGKGDATAEEIDLNEVMNEVCLLHQADIAESNAEIIVGKLPVVRNYMAPVVQLFNNLVSNALKYRKPDIPPVIHVTAKQEGEFWELAVRDNGIGIEKEYLQKIFVIFQRLVPKDQYDGTGIGLAVVKKIVENLGGQVWVESTPGEGSTFYFTIRSIAE